MTTIGDEKWMTIDEYAREKLVTPQTIYNWIKDKKVITRKLMGKTLVKL